MQQTLDIDILQTLRTNIFSKKHQKQQEGTVKRFRAEKLRTEKRILKLSHTKFARDSW